MEELIVDLEGGVWGFVFFFGFFGIYVVFFFFEVGDYILLGDDVYGGIFCLFDKVFIKNGFEYMIIDMSNFDKIE